MKTTAIHLFLSVVVGVLIVGGAYHIMETITPETSAVKPSTLTSVSTNNEQYTSLAPTVHQAKPYKKTTVNSKRVYFPYRKFYRESHFKALLPSTAVRQTPFPGAIFFLCFILAGCATLNSLLKDCILINLVVEKLIFYIIETKTVNSICKSFTGDTLITE